MDSINLASKPRVSNNYRSNNYFNKVEVLSNCISSFSKSVWILLTWLSKLRVSNNYGSYSYFTKLIVFSLYLFTFNYLYLLVTLVN